MFNVTVGVQNIYTFRVSDSNNFTVAIDELMPQGSQLFDDGNGRYTFRWRPESSPSTILSFVAVDELGAATLHSPVLHVCACFNGGQCTLEGVPSTDQLIQNLTCICPEGNVKLLLRC